MIDAAISAGIDAVIGVMIPGSINGVIHVIDDVILILKINQTYMKFYA